MMGLDTNVLVRYIMQDDAKQAAKATKLIESLSPDAPGFVTLVSVIELVWVLSSCFGCTFCTCIHGWRSGGWCGCWGWSTVSLFPDCDW